MRLFAFAFVVCFSLCFAQNWIKKKHTVDVKGDNGFSAVDYDPAAKQIKGHVECSSQCDIFLMTIEEYHKLNSSKAFEEIDGKTRTGSYEFKPITDQNIIKQHLHAVVVNQNAPTIEATFILDQDIESGRVNGFIWLLIFIAPICCFCCSIFIVCGIIGALRNTVLDALGMRSKSDYEEFGESISFIPNSSDHILLWRKISIYKVFELPNHVFFLDFKKNIDFDSNDPVDFSELFNMIKLQNLPIAIARMFVLSNVWIVTTFRRRNRNCLSLVEINDLLKEEIDLFDNVFKNLLWI
eukprot:gene7313-11632_t